MGTKGTAALALILVAGWGLLVMLWTGGPTPALAHTSCAVPHHPDQLGYQAAYQPSKAEGITALNNAGFNQLFAGDPNFGLGPMEQGPRTNRTVTSPYMPPTLLKAIGWVEGGSNAIGAWSQTSGAPQGAFGPPLVSFDCGYGIMQVTFGAGVDMRTRAPEPIYSTVQVPIATDYRKNIAFGARILLEKWNAAPEYRPIVGNGNPKILEDWYYAIWGYNGFASVNDPNRYSSTRGEFSCGPLNDGFGHDRTRYPYQELVVGCVKHPPIVAGSPLWPAIAMTLPSSVPAFNSNGTGMDIPTPQPSHTDPTQPGGGGGGGGSTVPAAPTNLVATVTGPTTVALSWTDNANNESGFQVGRTVQSNGVCGTFRLAGQTGPNVTTFTDSGLTTGTTYCYAVLAFNAAGASALSNVVTATPGGSGLPAAPTGLVATATGPTTVALSWTDNANNESGFQVGRTVQSNGACGTFTLAGQTGPNVTTFTDSWLTTGTTYCYAVLAFNAAGASALSNVVTATPGGGSPPAAPTGLTAAAVDQTSIALNWTDNASNEDGFTVERALASGSGCGSFAEVGQVGANVTTFSDTSLQAATTYCYRVRAFAAGLFSAYSNVAMATTWALPTPSNLTALRWGNFVVLMWRDSSTNELGFWIQRASFVGGVCSGWAQVGQTGVNQSVFRDTLPAASGGYCYRVQAFNGQGTSAFSNVAIVQ